MRNHLLLIGIAITGAGPALAQQGTPSSMGPNDLERAPGVTGSTDPRNELPSVGGGIVLPNSAGDVTRRSDLKKAEIEKIKAMGDARRAEAIALAERVKKGAEVPTALVAKVREALAGDIELWRHGHQVGETHWQAMRERWLRPANTLTPAEWVLWRAAWFDELDKWIAETQSASR